MPGKPPCLFDHVKLPVRDIARSRAFYERALQPFGVRVVESSQGPGFTIDDREDLSAGGGPPTLGRRECLRVAEQRIGADPVEERPRPRELGVSLACVVRGQRVLGRP